MEPPTLMIKAEGRLSAEAAHRLREALEASRTGKPLLLDDGLKVYQIVDGKWVPLDPPAPPEPPKRSLLARLLGRS